jgi:polygalacturonase
MVTYDTGNSNMFYWVASQDEVMLFWKKPEIGEVDFAYQIWVDGREMGTVRHTFFCISDLQADTDYVVQINICLKGEEPKIWNKFMVMTKKGKKKLDVSKAPYLAVGDGKTLNTQILQQAIQDCGPEEVVYIPKGTFLTGALRLHSNMALYIEKGGVLQGTDRVEDYLPRIPSRFEGIEMECYSSLLNLGEMNHDGDFNCQNVSIRGHGIIASGGRSLAEKVIAAEKERMREELEQLGDRIHEYEKLETLPGRVRPRLINMSNCRNIWIEGVTLGNGASWNVHMIYSQNIVTNSCRFHSEGVWNGDGWDPDSTTDCAIFDCDFYTGDDAIAIKSGKNPEGNVIHRPTERIHIFSCRIHKGHGFAIGSEMSGGVEDVHIWDCDLSRSTYGVEIKGTVKRGGYVRNVKVDNCVVPRILVHSVSYNDDGVGAQKPPVIENCKFENMWVKGVYPDKKGTPVPCTAIELRGFQEEGHHLENISFRKIRLGTEGMDEHQTKLVEMENCGQVTFEDVRMPSGEEFTP